MNKVEENLNCYGYTKFSNAIAFKLGDTEAHVLAALDRWINYHKEKEKNCNNPIHYRDNHWVTYLTIPELNAQILISSERSIKRAIKHLKELGIIIVSHHSSGAYRHTNWYSIDYCQLAEVMRDECESAKMAPLESAKMSSSESAKMAPYTINNYTINNKHNNTINSPTSKEQVGGDKQKEIYKHITEDLNADVNFANAIIYFIKSYSEHGLGNHPDISENKIMEIYDEYYNAIDRNNICAGDWYLMIDNYFNQSFSNNCDYRIFHFFTPRVLDNVYYHIKDTAI